jgi:hypothetical protein
MKTGLLMVAAVAAAAGVGVVAQQRPAVPRPYDAAVPGRASPQPLDPPANEEGEALRGRVLEVIQVEQYTYLRLSASRGEVWAAVSKANIQVGADVAVSGANRMENFASPTLKRTFDIIYFGSLEAPGSSSTSTLPMGHPPIGGPSGPLAQPATAAPPPPETAEIARAVGDRGHTIAELFEQREALKGQPVRVRGQVVKVTPGVLGKTYLRLRDGSGAPNAEPRELVVTTQAPQRVGDVATFEGRLLTDVDVGIGFVYPVLLADAEPLAEPAPAPSVAASP